MKNNKGFMLAEVIVTSTIVMTSLLGLYVTFNKLNGKYNTRMSYFDVDGVYAIKGIVNNLIDSGSINDVLKGVTETDAAGNVTYHSISVINNKNCNASFFKNDNFNVCNNIKDSYSVENMYVVSYTEEGLEVIKNGTSRNTFKDYLSYLQNGFKTFYNAGGSSFIDDGEVIEAVEDDGSGGDSMIDEGAESAEFNYYVVVEYKNNQGKMLYSSLGLG